MSSRASSSELDTCRVSISCTRHSGYSAPLSARERGPFAP